MEHELGGWYGGRLVVKVPEKRKRAKRNSACLICKAAHRSCSTERPCKRCISLGLEEECLKAVPVKNPSKKRKLEGSPPGGSSQNSSPPTATTIDPYPPSIYDKESPIDPRSTFPHTFSTFNTIETQTTPEAPIQSLNSPRDRLLLNLLDEVKQLNETTAKLREEQQTLARELSLQVRTAEESQETAQKDEELHTRKELGTKAITPFAPRRSIQQVPFMPFFLKDATKPFAIIKPCITDHQGFAELFKKPPIYFFKHPFYLLDVIKMQVLMPSPSFCRLFQYQAEELLGEDATYKIKYPDTQPALDFYRWIAPQSPDVHVSPIVLGAPLFRDREGRIIRAFTKARFFYVDGQVSFFVCGFDSYEFVREEEIQMERATLAPYVPQDPSPNDGLETRSTPDEKEEGSSFTPTEDISWANALPPSPLSMFSPSPCSSISLPSPPFTTFPLDPNSWC